MITDKEKTSPRHEVALEEESSLERYSAPTVRDLRAAPKDLFMDADAESQLAPPDDRLPPKPD
ncbi:MAG TPA: hypothetical protein VIM99_13295 [Blastocatellia bacterium]